MQHLNVTFQRISRNILNATLECNIWTYLSPNDLKAKCSTTCSLLRTHVVHCTTIKPHTGILFEFSLLCVFKFILVMLYITLGCHIKDPGLDFQTFLKSWDLSFQEWTFTFKCWWKIWRVFFFFCRFSDKDILPYMKTKVHTYSHASWCSSVTTERLLERQSR